MGRFISRFNSRGRSIVNDIYRGIEEGSVRIIATEIADGRRLDHYAQKYYGNSLNYWIIAAASGIRWPLGVGPGAANLDEDQDNIVLYIPNMQDIIELKRR